jgi:hypothetical protein
LTVGCTRFAEAAKTKIRVADFCQYQIGIKVSIGGRRCCLSRSAGIRTHHARGSTSCRSCLLFLNYRAGQGLVSLSKMFERNFVLALTEIKITKFIVGRTDATRILGRCVEIERCLQITERLRSLAAL